VTGELLRDFEGRRCTECRGAEPAAEVSATHVARCRVLAVGAILVALICRRCVHGV